MTWVHLLLQSEKSVFLPYSCVRIGRENEGKNKYSSDILDDGARLRLSHMIAIVTPYVRNLGLTMKPMESRGYKPKTKAPLSTTDRSQRLFTSLCAQIDGGHFRNAVKTCDKSMLCFQVGCHSLTRISVLSLDSSDKDALQAKIYLLLQTERYAEALSLLDTRGSLDIYERAYTLYRLQRENEARDVLEKVKEKGEDDRGTVHLEAQLVMYSFLEAFPLSNLLLLELQRRPISGGF